MAEPNLNADANRGYGTILKDISEHTKELIQAEMSLVKAEIKTALPRAARHSGQMVLFGTICALSVLPLLAFLVIGLGGILGGNYWLSSLIVAVIFAAVGAPLAMSSFKKLKEEDLTLDRTKAGLGRGVQVVQEKIQDVTEAVKGDTHGYHH